MMTKTEMKKFKLIRSLEISKRINELAGEIEFLAGDFYDMDCKEDYEILEEIKTNLESFAYEVSEYAQNELDK